MKDLTSSGFKAQLVCKQCDLQVQKGKRTFEPYTCDIDLEQCLHYCDQQFFLQLIVIFFQLFGKIISSNSTILYIIYVFLTYNNIAGGNRFPREENKDKNKIGYGSRVIFNPFIKT